MLFGPEKNEAIITSLDDSDLYEFTMLQVFLHQFPTATAVWRYKCRSEGLKLDRLVGEVNYQLDALCELKFTEEALAYLKALRFIKPQYVDFLRLFKFNRDHILAEARNGSLHIETANVAIPYVLGFEMPVLQIVSELYTQSLFPERSQQEALWAEGQRRLDEKIDRMLVHPAANTYQVTEFGGRRRAGKKWHWHVTKTLQKRLGKMLAGTSNVALARETGLVARGTMAHAYLQAFQALEYRLEDSQKAALEAWVREYRGDLGIALTDVIGVDAFVDDLDLYHGKLFDGFRWDSGKPVMWGWKILKALQDLRIDPKTKVAFFTDGLDDRIGMALHEIFRNHFQSGPSGIGTFFTNDLGFKAPNQVMKMVSCNGRPVAKISDSPGKGMCDSDRHVQDLMRAFGLQLAA